jgi:hypothetical protein
LPGVGAGGEALAVEVVIQFGLAVLETDSRNAIGDCGERPDEIRTPVRRDPLEFR